MVVLVLPLGGIDDRGAIGQPGGSAVIPDAEGEPPWKQGAEGTARGLSLSAEGFAVTTTEKGDQGEGGRVSGIGNGLSR
jgi:hypothetical protein